jgi:hypothetical protein
MSDGVATRVSLGNTLRAFANRVPAATNLAKCGVAAADTMSGLNPSNATSTKRDIDTDSYG